MLNEILFNPLLSGKGLVAVELLLNSIGSVASVGGFALSLLVLLKETPVETSARRRRAIWSLIIAVGCVVLIIVAVSQLYEGIRTFEQGESFTASNSGESSVFYAVPYKTNPNLMINQSRDGYGDAKIVEERPDGFIVFISSDPESFRWRAKGIPLPQVDQ